MRKLGFGHVMKRATETLFVEVGLFNILPINSASTQSLRHE